MQDEGLIHADAHFGHPAIAPTIVLQVSDVVLKFGVKFFVESLQVRAGLKLPDRYYFRYAPGFIVSHDRQYFFVLADGSCEVGLRRLSVPIQVDVLTLAFTVNFLPHHFKFN